MTPELTAAPPEHVPSQQRPRLLPVSQIRLAWEARQDSTSTPDAWSKPSRQFRPQAPLLQVADALAKAYRDSEQNGRTGAS